MTTPLEKTIRHLAKSANQHAARVLISALDCESDLRVRELVISELLELNKPRYQSEIISRFQQYDEQIQGLVTREATHLTVGLQQSLQSKDDGVVDSAISIIEQGLAIELIPALLPLLNGGSITLSERSFQAFNTLVNRLHEHLSDHTDSPE